MALNLVTLQASLKNLIDKNNSTTSSYDISSSLNERVKFIGIGDVDNSPIPNTQYPAVLVKLKSKSEEFSQLGNSAKRKCNISFEVCPITMYGMGVGLGGQKADEECIYLAQNIEALLRAYITLSSTVDYSLIVNTTFEDKVQNDTWNKIARITLETYKLTV